MIARSILVRCKLISLFGSRDSLQKFFFLNRKGAKSRSNRKFLRRKFGFAAWQLIFPVFNPANR